MLYPKNKEKLNLDLFKNPTSEYRATPFWAWNCELSRDILFREIECMKKMGMGGFHMHSRAGMATEYLSDEFMSLVRDCNKKAREENMLSWLYDEDKWPSGFAGGYVTKKPENRQRYLVLTKNAYSGKEAKADEQGANAKISNRSENGYLVAKYDITLNDVGDIISYKRLTGDESGENVWYAYIETSSPGAWFNFETYVDTLKKSAIEDFVNITHERYKEALGDELGKSAPAIFCDEPQVAHKTRLPSGKAVMDIILPFTDDFDDTYQATYGASVYDTLPEIVWERADGPSRARLRYHDHVTERFVSAFCDTIGVWCKKNGIHMTGHMMEEPSLRSQTCAIGEAMRAYRAFTLPGVDMLADAREFTTLKQTASAAHQFGREGIMSELYGVTGWDFDFRGHKIQGDWQSALGVSVRVPHLYWVSMKGQAKRDYPASIGHQSSWYPEYSFIEDHMARVTSVMTRGKADIKIGVVHPIESYWMRFGPADRTSTVCTQMDNRFFEITNWLLGSTLDFDYICESLLPTQYKESDEGFTVGEMSYDAVILPAMQTIRKTTLDALDKFIKKGGKVIVMGGEPEYIEAIPSDEIKAVLGGASHIEWDKTAMTDALEPYRTVKVLTSGGAEATNVIYGMREDGENKNLFLCHAHKCSRNIVPMKEKYYITVSGEYSLTLMDTQNGEVSKYPAKVEGGKTVFEWECYSQSSLLLVLEPYTESADQIPKISTPDYRGGEPFKGECELSLEEPNVLVLDMAKWCIDGGEWNSTDEMIRISNFAKEKLGLSTGVVKGAQPWAYKAPVPTHTVTVEAELESEIDIEDAYLALEDFDIAEISVNGKAIEKKASGYYVDYSITKVYIGKINKGKNTVRVTKPFGVVSEVENMFLLGDFGVKVEGNKATVIAPTRTVRFGDITTQGLAFYGGVMSYKMKIEGGSDTAVSLGLFHAPAIVAYLDGVRVGDMSLAPHAVELGKLSPGEHTLEFKVYLSRVNTFGTLHYCNYDDTYLSPRKWYSTGADYSYEYRIIKSGLLTAPRIIKR